MAKKAATTKVETEAATKTPVTPSVASEEKKAADKIAEKKTTVTKTAKAATEKAAEVVKEAAAKTAATAKKAAAKKPAAKKAAPKKEAAATTEVYVQYWGKEVYAKDVVAAVKKVWTDEMGRKEADIKDLKVYIKPEDDGAHYVVNGDITGFIKL